MLAFPAEVNSDLSDPSSLSSDVSCNHPNHNTRVHAARSAPLVASQYIPVIMDVLESDGGGELDYEHRGCLPFAGGPVWVPGSFQCVTLLSVATTFAVT